MNNSYITIIKEKRTVLSRKRVPLNQNECTADFGIGVPFEQNLQVMFDTIHHIAIIGSDYEKSKHFYVDLLGFEVIRENYRKERDDYKIDLACGPQEIGPHLGQTL